MHNILLNKIHLLIVYGQKKSFINFYFLKNLNISFETSSGTLLERRNEIRLYLDSAWQVEYLKVGFLIILNATSKAHTISRSARGKTQRKEAGASNRWLRAAAEKLGKPETSGDECTKDIQRKLKKGPLL